MKVSVNHLSPQTIAHTPKKRYRGWTKPVNLISTHPMIGSQRTLSNLVHTTLFWNNSSGTLKRVGITFIRYTQKSRNNLHQVHSKE